MMTLRRSPGVPDKPRTNSVTSTSSAHGGRCPVANLNSFHNNVTPMTCEGGEKV